MIRAALLSLLAAATGRPVPAATNLPFSSAATGLPASSATGLPGPADATGRPVPTATTGLPPPAATNLPGLAAATSLPRPAPIDLPVPAAATNLPVPAAADLPASGRATDVPPPAAATDRPASASEAALPTSTRSMAFPSPVTDADYRPTDPARVEMGRLLFWDPILSGNRDISCGTCHHPRFGTGDGLSLGTGEGGVGLGPDRVADPANPPEQRIPRNAPGLWNLGAHEFARLFHDGRIETLPDGTLRTPMGPEMTQGFDTLLSAQTMFPVLSADEMAGHYSENEVSRAVRQGIITGEGGAWDLLAARVRAIPDYDALWRRAFPGDDELDFTDISDAIGEFVEAEWRSDTAPFDGWLRGARDLPPRALEGVELFYGAAGCSTCHSGPFQTDHGFHATGQPQLGPGKRARFEPGARDEGRLRVTGDPADRFAFRTPSLRNVTETGPWGHAGAYSNLRDVVRAHAAPRTALAAYLRDATLPALDGAEDWHVMDDAAEVTALAAAARGPDRILTEAEVTALMAFLETLRDPDALHGRQGIPETVPSGLPVDR